MPLRVVRAADAVPMPWRNGGGSTREYVRRPADGDLEWRVSVAEVAADGPFSVFPGIDRVLVLLDGAGMVLTGPTTGEVHLQRPLDLVCFPGEAEISAHLIGGPTTDFNVMVDRARWSVSVATPVVHGDSITLDGDTVVVYVHDGAVTVANDRGDEGPAEVLLEVGDLATSDGPLTVRGHGVVIAASMSARGA